MTKIAPTTHRHINKFLAGTAMALCLAALGTPAMAQQAGTVNGNVTSSSGTALSGVIVEARSPVLPGVRTATSSANGRYQLPFLPPGEYELTFRGPDGTVIKKTANVLLQQKIKVDAAMTAADEIVVVGQKISVDTGQASLKATIGAQAIESVPTGQEYRDLIKLIPGVQYSENSVRGPSAGGNGQDNVYQFDGVDVSLPMFGTLAAEPSSHDIDQVSIVRGGATAVGFNRSGGFKVNTISKRGTNEYHGEISYQIQNANFTAEQKIGTRALTFDEDKKWITANLGGPIIKDKLLGYASYYRPTTSRANQENAYGPVGDFKSTRNEYFGKLTFAPTDALLLDVSYRTSKREVENAGIGSFTADTASEGTTVKNDIIIAEGSYVIDDNTSLSFKFTDFKNKNASRPDTILDIPIQLGAGLSINTAALDTQGRFSVPTLRTGGTPEDLLFNAGAQPLIDQFGYIDDSGNRAGGGVVGAGSTINNQDFDRRNYEVAFDRTISAGDATHDIHIGFQHQDIGEDLNRFTNGFGSIRYEGGLSDADNGTPVHYIASLGQQNILDASGNPIAPPNIRSAAKLQSFEINDTIEDGNWTFNLGVLISNDKLYGQGLIESSHASGFDVAPGNRYLMHESKWKDMIQPRFGVLYDFGDRDTVYANFARYNPAATSLSRAASWDRRLARSINLRFDVNGDFIDIDAVRSSTGKLFQDGIKPRFVNEYLAGWNRIVNDDLSVKMHARYRKGGNFWEDTPNDARIGEPIRDGIDGTRFPSLAPPEIQALGLYIPQMDNWRSHLGLDTRLDRQVYVIAQLDGAETDYYEAGLEAEYTGDNFYINGSYTWSKYTGNFDQDNISGNNDRNLFIGSSSFADGVGRNQWNNRQGRQRGDRPHQFKVFGYYDLPWNGRVGAYSIFQSGQPWATWSNAPYAGFTRSGSSFLRFAEPAGSNRTDSHFQLDLNYSQSIEVLDGYMVELRADLYNAFNSQTGYNIQTRDDRAGFGDPRSFFNPRRLQLTAKARF